MVLISPRPAQNAQEAVQWLYFRLPGKVKSQNGGAMSLGHGIVPRYLALSAT